jgi:undecaprenyl-diphosphatase
LGLVEAVILGIVQGITEFLPISSTAHIRILPALVGWQDPGAPFTAAIQIGTLLAVLIYFRKELGAAFLGWIGSIAGKGSDPVGARMGWAIVVGTVPIVFFGVLFKDSIENQLRSLYVIAWALIGMGIVLLIAEALGSRKRNEDDVRIRDGIWVGLWQALALIPGMSRSGSSIAGALFAGFDRASAARFSFLLSVPSVFAAAVYSLIRHRHELVSGHLFVPMVVANVAAFVSGYAAIALLIYVLKKSGTLPFVAYRIALGLFILRLVWAGHLSPTEGMGSSN